MMAVREGVMDPYTMDYGEAVEWCEKNEVDIDDAESFEEIQSLIALRLSTNGQGPNETSDPPLDDEQNKREAAASPDVSMTSILERDLKMKLELATIYDKLLQLTGATKVRTIQQKVNKLDRYRRQLIDDECPIVIAGETSAGKSTLLNLLLGSDVLPHRLLCATSTICRLHNSEDKRLEIRGGEEEDLIITIGDEGDGDSALRKEIERVCAQPRDGRVFQSVDIFWPLPILQNNITMVDTPGIGESEEMTQKVLRYLPNATAFIYVVDIKNAGGVQRDKLLRLFEEQKQNELSGDLPASVDFSSVLFVCNKWDIVEDDPVEAEKLWHFTVDKLKQALPGLPDEKIFKMSALKELKHRKNGFPGHTEPFRALLRGIEQMVPRCFYSKISRHFRWIDELLRDLQKITAAHLRYARCSAEDRHGSQKAMNEKLKELKQVAKMIKERLLKQLEQDCEGITTQLYDYLHSADTKEKLLRWETSDRPTEIVDTEAINSRLQGRIEEAITSWETEYGALKALSKNMLDTFEEERKRLGHQLKEMDHLVEGVDVEDKIHSILGETSSKSVIRFLFSKSEKMVLAFSSPLWLPLAAAASLLLVPVGVGVLIKRSLTSGDGVTSNVERNRKKVVDQMNRVITTFFEKDNIAAFVRSSYYEVLKNKIEKLCTDLVENRIDAEEDLVDSLQNEQRSPKEIEKQYRPIQKRLVSIVGRFQLYRLKYMVDDLVPADSLTIRRRIGAGNYSEVFLADWQRTSTDVVPVALKCLRDIKHEEDLYLQLTEIECLRQLRHPNLVGFYGISYSGVEGTERPTTSGESVRSDDQDDSGVSCDSIGATWGPICGDTWRALQGYRLMLLMELCGENLEDKIFTSNSLICRKYDDVKHGAGKDCFRFYVTMATGICEGLSYMHTSNFAHRDLKLSNILVHDNVAKISDLGFARHELEITGTFVGTISHMSPEVLRQRGYTTTTDIYSLAILLWEMWFGRHVFSESRYSQISVLSLMTMVRQGERPMLHVRSRMPAELQDLVRQCWDDDPSARPTALSVGKDIRRVYNCLCGDDI